MTLSGKRIAVYARFSTDKQSASSIDDQIAKARRFVEDRGGSVDPLLVFSDAAVSGVVRERPGSSALERALRDRRIDVLVVESLSRLARHEGDQARWRELVPFCGARLLTYHGGFDSALESSDLLGPMTGVIDAQYRKTIAKMTRRGCEARARAGFATGAVPFGYSTERVPFGGGEASKIVIDETAAELVRWVYARAREGASLATIATELNARRIDPPRRKNRLEGWQVSTVRAILRNPVYTGRWTYGAKRWDRDPDTRARVPLAPTAEVYVSERPELAIIDREAFDAVSRRFAGMRLEKVGRRRVPAGMRCTYALSGVLRCGVCGVAMTIAGGVEGDRYYVCKEAKRGVCSSRGAIRERSVKASLVAGITARLEAPDARTAIAAELAVAMGESDLGRTHAELRARVQRLERQIAALVDVVAEGGAPASIVARLRELEASLALDRGALARAAAEAAGGLEAPGIDEVLAEVAASLDGPPQAVREALRGILGGSVSADPNPGGWTLRGVLRFPAILGDRAGNLVYCGDRI